MPFSSTGLPSYLVLAKAAFALKLSSSAWYIVLIKDGIIAKTGSVDEVMDERVLGAIYEMDFTIHEVNGRKLCVYD